MFNNIELWRKFYYEEMVDKGVGTHSHHKICMLILMYVGK